MTAAGGNWYAPYAATKNLIGPSEEFEAGLLAQGKAERFCALNVVKSGSLLPYG